MNLNKKLKKCAGKPILYVHVTLKLINELILFIPKFPLFSVLPMRTSINIFILFILLLLILLLLLLLLLLFSSSSSNSSIIIITIIILLLLSLSSSSLLSLFLLFFFCYLSVHNIFVIKLFMNYSMNCWLPIGKKC